MSLVLLFQNLSVHFVDVTGEQIETGHDSAVWPELVLVHDFFVIVKSSYVEVAGVWGERDGGVGVDDKWERVLIADEVVFKRLIRPLKQRSTCRCRPCR